MALPGEARSVTKCEDCGEKMSIEVHRSPAGYYIGQWFVRQEVLGISRERQRPWSPWFVAR